MASFKAPRTGRVPVRVVLADRQGLFRTSLRHLLDVPPTVLKDVYGVDVWPGFRVLGEAGSGEEAVMLVRSLEPDLLLLNLSLPRMSGLEVVRQLEPSRNKLRVVLLADTFTRAELLTAIQFDVGGLVLKDSSTALLFEAIMHVMQGGRWLGKMLVTDLVQVVQQLMHSSGAAGGSFVFGLTPREYEVLRLVAGGHGNRAIAQACGVSEETVKHHVTRIFRKVGASNRAQLALVAVQCGLETPT